MKEYKEESYMKFRVFRVIALLLVVVMLAGCGPIGGSKTTINGVDISEFTIVYSQHAPDYCQRAAEYIREKVFERTGLELAVCTADSGTYTHEILVGDTDRVLSQELRSKNQKMEFYLKANEKDVALNADYFIIAAAAYYFVETYIPGDTFQSEIGKDSITVAQPITQTPNNYIFLIGDGMGPNHIKMFDYLSLPQTTYYDGEMIFYGEYLPYQGVARTNSLSGVTDSAAAATALSTGNKTTNSRVGRDADGNDLQSLTELAISKGMATAVMSTDQMIGATPAGFSAHADDRDDSKSILAGQTKLMTESGTKIVCGLHATKEYQTDISQTLEELDQNENGFFLMYEEGHIDKFSHSNSIEDTFACVIRFNQAIGLFMEYAFYHPDTFVLITADHETGGLMVKDGALKYTTESHTGTDVPVYAYGAGAEAFQNFNDENTQIPKNIAAMWGVQNFGEFRISPLE